MPSRQHGGVQTGWQIIEDWVFQERLDLFGMKILVLGQVWHLSASLSGSLHKSKRNDHAVHCVLQAELGLDSEVYLHVVVSLDNC